MSLTDGIRKAGLATRLAKAQARAEDLKPVISAIRASGITSRYGMAKALNGIGIPAARGGPWTQTQVKRLLARLSGKDGGAPGWEHGNTGEVYAPDPGK
jgi:hypothetical protein